MSDDCDTETLVKLLEELDPSDEYHKGNDYDAGSYYAAIDRAIKIVNGDLKNWMDLG